MNFDFGAVLSRAWQITWRHKYLWLAGILVSLMGFVSLPISFLTNPAFSGNASAIEEQLPEMLLANGLILLLSILSVPLYVLGMVIPSLETYRLERGSPRSSFGELARSTLPYFWRILGIFGLIWLGMVVFMLVFMAFAVGLSFVTMGLGMLCMFPMMLLFIPVGILVFALMEQGTAAVLVDNLGVFAALERAWHLIWKNPGVMTLMSLIIYLGSSLVSMVLMVPLMIPMFGFMFRMGPEPDFEAVQQMTRNMILLTMAFAPVYALLQGFLLTFMQSAWMLTYMRLTQSPDPAPVMLEANA